MGASLRGSPKTAEGLAAGIGSQSNGADNAADSRFCWLRCSCVSLHERVRSELPRADENPNDELNRAYQTDSVLFANVGSPDIADGATSLGKGNLVPGDNDAIPGVAGVTILGRVNTRTEYDRNSRPTFIVDDDADTHRTFYDGVDRVVETLDAEGNTVETAYDDTET